MHLTMSQKLLPVIHVIRVHVWSSTGIHCLEIDNWITLKHPPPPFCKTRLAGADLLGHILVIVAHPRWATIMFSVPSVCVCVSVCVSVC